MTNFRKADTTRIFILSNYLLLVRGLIELLKQDDRFQIIGQNMNTKLAIEQIEILQPDIIIIGRSGASRNGLQLQQLLKVNPAITVIELSLDDNKLYVYQAAEHEVNEVEDLITVLSQTVPSSA